MSQNVYINKPNWTTSFIQVIYNPILPPQSLSGQLAPIVGLYPSDTYITGALLAQYTEANAPEPYLVGKFVNYSDASANPDQKIPVAILLQQNPLFDPLACIPNVDGTYPEIQTFLMVWLTNPLTISQTALLNANEQADVTAFLGLFPHYLDNSIGTGLNGQPDTRIVLK